MGTFNVPIRAAKIANAAASERTRLPLEVVKIDRNQDGRITISATDGHIALIGTFTEDDAREPFVDMEKRGLVGDKEPAFVDAEAMKQVAKSKAGHFVRVVSNAEETVLIRGDTCVFMETNNDVSRFPAITDKRVIPEGEADFTTRLSTKMLQRIVDCCGDCTVQFDFFKGSPLKPIRISVNGDEDDFSIRGAVMPMSPLPD